MATTRKSSAMRKLLSNPPDAKRLAAIAEKHMARAHKLRKAGKNGPAALEYANAISVASMAAVKSPEGYSATAGPGIIVEEASMALYNLARGVPRLASPVLVGSNPRRRKVSKHTTRTTNSGPTPAQQEVMRKYSRGT